MAIDLRFPIAVARGLMLCVSQYDIGGMTNFAVSIRRPANFKAPGVRVSYTPADTLELDCDAGTGDYTLWTRAHGSLTGAFDVTGKQAAEIATAFGIDLPASSAAA